MSREQLFDAMINRKPVYINGIRHLLNSIEMEDGSGYAFNLSFAASAEGLPLRTRTLQIFYRCEQKEKRLRQTAYYIDTI